MNGWFGIALYQPKTEANLGVVIRSAHAFGAAFVALIGHRYKHVPTDTTKADRSLPIFYFSDSRAFTEAMHQYPIIAVEVNRGQELSRFSHPKQAVYVLGGEDRTLPEIGHGCCHIRTKYCLNLGAAATALMYARHSQISKEGA